MSQETKDLQEALKRRIDWSEKLNRISLDLPQGIWLSELTYKLQNFSFKCSVVSLQKEEMREINRFLNSLKGDSIFFRDFNALELGPLTRRTIGSCEVVDFSLSGTLK